MNKDDIAIWILIASYVSAFGTPSVFMIWLMLK